MIRWREMWKALMMFLIANRPQSKEQIMAHVGLMYKGVVVAMGRVVVDLQLLIEICIWEGYQRITTIQVRGFITFKMHIDHWIGSNHGLILILSRLLLEPLVWCGLWFVSSTWHVWVLSLGLHLFALLSKFGLVSQYLLV